MNSGLIAICAAIGTVIGTVAVGETEAPGSDLSRGNDPGLGTEKEYLE
jgi:hypothetical protein